ncbi:GNAT family N-acetyltransferase [Pelagibacterium limicola]|uniref:GNAT family N-acetyltransferase n=1 Tax=Pelagibacterium limicola TaxID=2791022 RepID=UPI0018AF73C9
MTHAPRLEFVDEPGSADIEAVTAILGAAAEAQRPGGNYRDYGFLLKNEAGVIVGGLTGYVLYDWMFIQFIAISEDLRGQGFGKLLIEQAEIWARAEGLGGMWLDTFAFQAPDFYRALGFTEFGTIEDHPAGSRRIFFQKRLT